jgi:hypothetical protein
VRNQFVDAFAELLKRERLTTWLVTEPAPDLRLPMLAEPAFFILERNATSRSTAKSPTATDAR